MHGGSNIKMAENLCEAGAAAHRQGWQHAREIRKLVEQENRDKGECRSIRLMGSPIARAIENRILWP
jgi:hypothetical protein